MESTRVALWVVCSLNFARLASVFKSVYSKSVMAKTLLVLTNSVSAAGLSEGLYNCSFSCHGGDKLKVTEDRL